MFLRKAYTRWLWPARGRWPTLAMLSGQKSALESIQATDCYLPLRSLLPGPAKALVTFNKERATYGVIATDLLPKVFGASTAARTARVAE